MCEAFLWLLLLCYTFHSYLTSYAEAFNYLAKSSLKLEYQFLKTAY